MNLLKRALLGLALLAPLPLLGQQTYFAQASAGSNNGTSCANARAVSTLASGDWGAGKGVHLCGTITSSVSVGASGASGNVTSLIFETGAQISMGSCGATGCINAAGKSFVLIDGGSTGVIQATNSGTGLGSGDSVAIYARGGVSNLEVKNLAINSMYVKTSTTDTHSNNYFGVWLNGTNNLIHDNAINNAYAGIKVEVTSSGNQFYNNTIHNINWGIFESGSGSNSITNEKIYNNEIYDFDVWDTTTDVNHHDGIFLSGNSATTDLTHVDVYNNYLHGTTSSPVTCGPAPGNGSCMTAYIYINTDSFVRVFNNLLVMNAGDPGPNNGEILMFADANDALYNNTLIGGGNGANNSSCMVLDAGTGFSVENNIMSNCPNLLWNNGSTITALNFNTYQDSSLSWRQGSNFYTTLSAWRTAVGAEASSQATTGSLNLSGGFVPNSGSIAIGAATNLTGLGITPLDSDRAGSARPASGVWDAGAYNAVGTTFALSTGITGTGSGTVTGTNCPSGTYASGTAIGPCTANPASGDTFLGWSGTGSCSAVSGTGTASCTLTANSTLSAMISAATAVATPTYSPTSLSVPGRVTVSDSTSGAVCHYTVDGTTPTTASAEYTHPLYIGQSQTVKTICAAAGLSDSAVASQAYTIPLQATRFSLTRTSTSQTPSPFPQDDRLCCGPTVEGIEASRGSFNFSTLDTWFAQAIAHGAKIVYTLQAIPSWMSGNTNGSAPPNDLTTSAACSGVLAGTTTTDCKMKEFLTALLMHRTGLSSQPSSPVPCGIDKLEMGNEYNTDSSSTHHGTGWEGTVGQWATLSNDMSRITHTWCSDTKVVAGSSSAIVGFHANGDNSHFDIYLLAYLTTWGAIPHASLPDELSFHIYGSRGNVKNVPMPTTLASNNDTADCPGTSNSNCYVAVKDQVNRLNSTATLQNSAIVSWAKFLLVESTEGGFGQKQQLCGAVACTDTDADTVTLRSAYVSESMLLIAAQGAASHLFYAAFDCATGTNWGCYEGSPSVGWYSAFTTTNTWLTSTCPITPGAFTSTAVTGGNVWTKTEACGQYAFFDGWLTNHSTTTTYSTVTDLSGASNPTGGSVTLSQKPVLLTSPSVTNYTLTVSTSGSGTGGVAGTNCTTGSKPSGTSVTCTETTTGGSIFAGWSGACTGTGACSFTMTANKSVTATFNPPITSPSLLMGVVAQ